MASKPIENQAPPAPITGTPDNGGQIAVPTKPADLIPRDADGKIGVGQ
jgi:hypothetical protein